MKRLHGKGEKGRCTLEQKYFVLVGLCINLFCFRGFIGIFNIVLTEYARFLQVPLATISACTGARSLANSISAIATPFIIRCCNAKRTMLMGLFICLCAVLCMATAKSVAYVYVGEFLTGAASCMVYSLPCIALINQWFERGQGQILGVVMGLSSIGGAVFSCIGGQLLRSLNERQVYLFLGSAILLVCFLATVFLLDIKTERLFAKKPGKAEARNALVLLCFPTFWLCVAGTMCIGGVVVNNLISPLLQSGGLGISEAAFCISVITLIGAGASYLAGTVRDRLGMTAMLRLILVDYILSMLCAILWTMTSNRALLWPLVLLLGMSQPILVFPSYLSAMFGSHALLAAGLLCSFQTLIQVLTLPVSGYLADVTGGFSITAGMWLLLLVCAVSAFEAAVRRQN